MTEIDKRQILNVLNQLNEFQSRLYIAREAAKYGRGGIKFMNEITGMSRTTIIKGIKELNDESLKLNGRIRKEGGGRKRIEKHDPELEKSLKEILDEGTAGDPMSLIKWVNKSFLNH